MTTLLCPQCRVGLLAAWPEWPEPERFILIQRPSPDDPSLEHRRQYHLWCRQCWFEHCPLKEGYLV